MGSVVQRMRLISRPDLKLVLLLLEGVPPVPVAEGHPLLDLVGEIRHVGSRDRAAQALDSDKRPLRIPERAHHRQRMGKLRPVEVNRPRRVRLPEVGDGIGEAAVSNLRRHRAGDSKVHQVFPVSGLLDEAREAPREPPLPVGIGQPHLLRKRREHDVAKP